MKYLYKFLFKRELNNFDLIGILWITYLAFSSSLWFYLLIIPLIFVSVLLTTHFEVKEKLDS